MGNRAGDKSSEQTLGLRSTGRCPAGPVVWRSQRSLQKTHIDHPFCFFQGWDHAKYQSWGSWIGAGGPLTCVPVVPIPTTNTVSDPSQGWSCYRSWSKGNPVLERRTFASGHPTPPGRPCRQRGRPGRRGWAVTEERSRHRLSAASVRPGRGETCGPRASAAKERPRLLPSCPVNGCMSSSDVFLPGHLGGRQEAVHTSAGPTAGGPGGFGDPWSQQEPQEGED